MQDDTNDPAVPRERVGRAAARRTVLLLGIGVGVGLALGVLLTLGVSATYTLVTKTIPETRDSVQVFNELNQLRQQINQLNEEKKLNEQAKEEAVRQALSAVASVARTPESGMAKVVPPARRPGDPFADLDAEIERLEQTQKVLNTILDMFSGPGKERAKDR
jgi:hypothetical protein